MFVNSVKKLKNKVKHGKDFKLRLSPNNFEEEKKYREIFFDYFDYERTVINARNGNDVEYGFRSRRFLSTLEKDILEALDKKWQYIARDKNGILYLYEKEPRKVKNPKGEPFNLNDECWEKKIKNKKFDLFPNLFKFVTWVNEDAFPIKELITEYYMETEQDEEKEISQ